MKLRDSINPPRYYQSNYDTPLSHKTLRRRSRTDDAPKCVEFNPNLPPAAFPTLDRLRPLAPRPRPQEQIEEEEEQQQQGIGDSALPSVHHRSGHYDAIKRAQDTVVELDDIPMEEVESYVASNGYQNSIYARNMAQIASTAGVESRLEGMSDSDGEIDHHEPDHDPNWTDLTPRMQVEIFDNLQQRHGQVSAIRMLGLSVQEQELLERFIFGRNAQVELENAQLERMRERQLRELLRIDNSVRNQHVPHRLVFRKISRQATRSLMGRADEDYLICRSDEVRDARRFLAKRGLDPHLVGDWSNTIATTSPVCTDKLDTREAEVQVDSGVGADSDADLLPAIEVVENHGEVSVGAMESFINVAGRGAAAKRGDTVLRNGQWNNGARWLASLYAHDKPYLRAAFEGNKVIHVKIGPEREAQVEDVRTCREPEDSDDPDNPPPYVDPKKIAKSWPPIDLFYSSSRTSRFAVDESQVARYAPIIPRRASALSNSHVLSRTMGGTWSYSSAERHGNHPVTSSERMQQRLEQARLEAQRPKTPETQRMTDMLHDCFKTPRPSPGSEDWSPQTTPGRILAAFYPDEMYFEDALFALESVRPPSPTSNTDWPVVPAATGPTVSSSPLIPSGVGSTQPIADESLQKEAEGVDWTSCIHIPSSSP
ncbi:hypothetical protein BDV25DRAFT_142361 [Aspergillus avenaceus]|uniref:Uncharacterized protein n=1 Tax=Aspergillus avenaceus TaxID=36643 RepID=A0A5N6TN95_ASPAV|nr:hypothetical protein BDV25DRAFT_142361 [Aspergillus avenaceus]